MKGFRDSQGQGMKGSRGGRGSGIKGVLGVVGGLRVSGVKGV